MPKKHHSTAAAPGSYAADLVHYLPPPAPTGNVLFVQSTNPAAGDATTKGYTPDNPFATLAYAIGRAIGTNGDVIVVMPGHAESVASAAAIALNVAGVRVVGEGVGRARPTFTFTSATGASFDISAANCSLENLVFINSIDAQTAVVNVTAANVTIKDCEFVLADSSTQAVVGVLASAAADRMVIEGCHFHGSSDAGVTNAISCGATDDTIIRNNVITGAFAVTGAINNSAAAVNFHVLGNVIVNRTADGDNKAIVLHASTVGLVANNRGAVIDSTSPAPVTAAAAFVSGNYFTGAVGVTAGALM